MPDTPQAQEDLRIRQMAEVFSRTGVPFADAEAGVRQFLRALGKPTEEAEKAMKFYRIIKGNNA